MAQGKPNRGKHNGQGNKRRCSGCKRSFSKPHKAGCSRPAGQRTQPRKPDGTNVEAF